MKVLSKVPLVILLILLSILVYDANSALGVDIAAAFQPSTYTCFKNNGMVFAIVRAFRSMGVLDKNVNISLARAQDAGLVSQIYMFPCRGKSARSQVDELINGVNSHLYSTIMIDVEKNPSAGCSWNEHGHDTNCLYLTELVEYLVKQKKKDVGIYSSKYMWQDIFGSFTACPGIAELAPGLWYSHYDKKPSFQDFTAFGGWKRPAIKQYIGDTTLCGVDVDLNYIYSGIID